MANYKALYRVYRPKTFAEVVGQDAIVTILQNQIKNHQISHAYLFTGPRGTGKTSVAKIFARAISCPNSSNGEPCGTCTLCQDSLNDTSVDIIEIDAASNNGVDEIRDLRDKVKFAPVHGKYKVYIIDEVHMLSSGAFNALLKTLEEPPEHAVFILATTEPHKLPDTIISRCQRYDFNRIPTPVMVEQLRKITQQVGVEAEDEALELIASHSEGGLRDAISLLDQCIVFGDNVVTESGVRHLRGVSNQGEMFQIADAILHSDNKAALSQIEDMVKQGKDVSILAGDIIAHFRALLVYQMTDRPAEYLSPYYQEDYRQQSQQFPLDRLLSVIDKLSHCQLEMRYATIPLVFLELAIMQLTTPVDATPQPAAPVPPKPQPQSQPKPAAQHKPQPQPKPVAQPEPVPPVIAGGDIPLDIGEQKAAAVIEQPTEPVQSMPPEAPAAPQPAQTVTKEVYEQLLDNIRKDNKGLFTMMHQGFYDGFENGKLTIGFPGEECEVFMQAVSKRKDEIAKYLSEMGFSDVKICVTMSKVDSVKAAEELFGKSNIEIIE